MSTEDDDIKPSNQALNQAALWLGVSDPQKLLDEDPAASAFQARPEGLGLGAKFLPHHKAAHIIAPLEKRFQKRLARDATGAEQDDSTPAIAKKPRTAKATGHSTSGQHNSSSDEDDRGRAGAFAPGRTGKQQSQSFAKHILLTSGKKKQHQAQHQQAKQQKHHTKQKQQQGRPQ